MGTERDGGGAGELVGWRLAAGCETDERLRGDPSAQTQGVGLKWASVFTRLDEAKQAAGSRAVDTWKGARVCDLLHLANHCSPAQGSAAREKNRKAWGIRDERLRWPGTRAGTARRLAWLAAFFGSRRSRWAWCCTRAGRRCRLLAVLHIHTFVQLAGQLDTLDTLDSEHATRPYLCRALVPWARRQRRLLRLLGSLALCRNIVRIGLGLGPIHHFTRAHLSYSASPTSHALLQRGCAQCRNVISLDPSQSAIASAATSLPSSKLSPAATWTVSWRGSSVAAPRLCYISYTLPLPFTASPSRSALEPALPTSSWQIRGSCTRPWKLDRAPIRKYSQACAGTLQPVQCATSDHPCPESTMASQMQPEGRSAFYKGHCRPRLFTASFSVLSPSRRPFHSVLPSST
jgi:hypothetical protein